MQAPENLVLSLVHNTCIWLFYYRSLRVQGRWALHSFACYIEFHLAFLKAQSLHVLRVKIQPLFSVYQLNQPEKPPTNCQTAPTLLPVDGLWLLALCAICQRCHDFSARALESCNVEEVPAAAYEPDAHLLCGTLPL